jgi:hypothetical protein
MKQKILPETPTLPLEAERMRPLLRDALWAARRDLESAEPPADEWVIYRPVSDGLTSQRVPAPNYRAAFNPVAATSSEARALTDYLWERGAFKVNITRDDDQDPTQEGWATFPWMDIVQPTLSRLLNLAATKDFVARGTFQPWRVEGADLEVAVEDLVDQLCNGHCAVHAIGPTVDLRPEGGPFEVEPGTVLEESSPESQALFLTQYRSEYLADDSRAWMRFGSISIKTRAPASDDGAASAAVAAAMDRLKWALMMMLGTSERRSVRMRLPLGVRMTTGASLKGFVSKLSKDFDAAIWAFGRACAAQLSRDILLEAAIGLEMLLLPRQAGESTYKFRLHGLALIEGESQDALYDDLDSIYSLRSKAAHGAASGEGEFRKQAERARILLGKAIFSAVTLADLNKIDLKASKGDLGDAVTALVRARVSRAT